MKIRHSISALSLMAVLAPFSRAAVTVDCTASASGIAFGVYNPLSALANASTGTLQVTCNGSGNGKTKITLNVTLSSGFSGTYATRKIFSAVNTLNYNIYCSTAYNQIVDVCTGVAAP